MLYIIMAFWDRIKNRRKSARGKASEKRSIISYNYHGSSFSLLGYNDNALTLPVLYATVKAISEDIARLPLQVFKTSNGGGREQVDNKAAQLLKLRPNPYMGAMDMRQAMGTQAMLHGDGYVYIQRGVRGGVTGLFPLETDKVTLLLRDGEFAYRVQTTDGTQVVLPKDILHIKAFTNNGYVGLSMLKYMAQTLKIGQLAEAYVANMLQNQARPGGILQFKQGAEPIKRGSDEEKRLKEQWNLAHQGTMRAGETAVIPPQFEYKEISLPKEDMQMINTRKFQRRDIAMLFRVPLHLLQDLEKSSFNNIAEQSLTYVKSAIAPICKRIEQELSIKLLTDKERKEGYYFEHNLNGLLAGDHKARSEYYAIMKQNGIFSINDIRTLENLSPVKGGDTYFNPANMVPLDYFTRAKATPPAISENSSPPARDNYEVRKAVRASARNSLETAYRKVATKLIADIRGSGFESDRLRLWADRLKTEQQQTAFEILHPPLLDIARDTQVSVEAELKKEGVISDEFVVGFGTAAARRVVGQIVNDAVDTIDDDEAYVDSLTNRYARDEGTRSTSAFAKVAMVAAGIIAFRWVAGGKEDCPFCQALDGRVVGVDDSFIGEEGLEAGGQTFRASGSVGHPPLHAGCDCSIVADI